MQACSFGKDQNNDLTTYKCSSLSSCTNPVAVRLSLIVFAPAILQLEFLARAGTVCCWCEPGCNSILTGNRVNVSLTGGATGACLGRRLLRVRGNSLPLRLAMYDLVHKQCCCNRLVVLFLTSYIAVLALLD